MLATNVDYYSVLGVTRDASDQELKSAYRKLAMQFHPDRNPGDHAAEERYKQASEAIQVLSDSTKRSLYDQNGGRGPCLRRHKDDRHATRREAEGIQETPITVEPIVVSPRRGEDIAQYLQLELSDVIADHNHPLYFNRKDPCVTCKGTGHDRNYAPQICSDCRGRGKAAVQAGRPNADGGRCAKCAGTGRVHVPCSRCKGSAFVINNVCIQVPIPAGLDNGTCLRQRCVGHAGTNGGSRGDVLVTVNIRVHDKFARRGNDLLCDLPVNYVQAVLGAEIEIPTFHGKVKVAVPKGVQPGKSIKIVGYGMPLPGSDGNEKGDLYVAIRIQVPRKITPEEQELLESLGKVIAVDNRLLYPKDHSKPQKKN
jgi:molecular chaperone DnaJ